MSTVLLSVILVAMAFKELASMDKTFSPEDSSIYVANSTSEHKLASDQVLAMNVHSFFILINSSTKFHNNNSGDVPGETFFDTYYRFMLPFNTIAYPQNVPTGVLLRDTLNVVAQHNRKHKGKDNFIPLEIWLSLKPTTEDLTITLDRLLKITDEINTIYSKTVSAVVIDYEFLKLNPESFHVVQQDIKVVNKKLRGRLACGFMFIHKNCHQPDLQRLHFEPQNFAILSADSRSNLNYFTLGLPHIWSCITTKLTDSITVMLHSGVTVDLKTKTYSQEWTYFADSELILLVIDVTFMYGDQTQLKTESTNDLSLNENWIRRPSMFDWDHSWVSINMYDSVDDLLIATVTEKFHTIIVDIKGSTNISQKLEQCFQLFAKYRENNNLKVKLMVFIDTKNYANNKALIDEVFVALSISDLNYHGMVDTLIIDRDRCLDDYYSSEVSMHPSKIEDILKVANMTWDYIFFKMKNLQLRHRLKLGTVFDKRETSSSEWIELFGKPTEDKTGSVDATLDNANGAETGSDKKWTNILDKLTSYQNQLGSWKLGLYKFDLQYMVYKLNICADLINSEGAQAAFKSLQPDIDRGEVLFSDNKLTLKNKNFREVFFFVVEGCTGSDTNMKKLSEFIYFHDIVNKWAVNENKSVIIGNAFEFERQSMPVCQCSSEKDICHDNECHCGLWTVNTHENKMVVVDKKSTLLTLFNEKVSTQGETKGIDSKFASWKILSISLPLLLLGVLIGAIAPYLIYRHRHKDFINKDQQRNFFKGSDVTNEDDQGSSVKGSNKANSCPYNKDRFEIGRSHFQFDSTRSLGSGEFGMVFPGTVLNRDGLRVSVAVKTIKRARIGERHGKEMSFLGLLSEIKLLCYLGQHKHIVTLVGANTVNLRRGEAYLFLEMCSNGALLNYLRACERKIATQQERNYLMDMPLNQDSHSQRGVQLTQLLSDMYRWAIEIAKGLEYLADKGVVHLDVAARNILLDQRKHAKISDFGLSRRLYGYSCYTKNGSEPLPWRWMSPESLQRSVFNEKTDVWAYGVTLWEIYTLGDIPYPELTWGADFSTLLRDGYRLKEPKYNEKYMYDLMQICWRTKVGERPTFSEVKLILNGEK